VTNADCPIDVDLDSPGEVYATAGDVDHDALDTQPDHS
jgi:hypothetical protein